MKFANSVAYSWALANTRIELGILSPVCNNMMCNINIAAVLSCTNITCAIYHSVLQCHNTNGTNSTTGDNYSMW